MCFAHARVMLIHTGLLFSIIPHSTFNNGVCAAEAFASCKLLQQRVIMSSSCIRTAMLLSNYNDTFVGLRKQFGILYFSC